jgi:Flp pilus assembly protein TadD
MRALLAWCVASAVAVAGTAAHAAWQEAKSKHFIVYANESPDELRSFAEKLERFDQAVRYIRSMADPDQTDTGRVKVFVVPDLDTIGTLIGRTGVAGFYRTGVDGSFAFVPKTTDMFVTGTPDGIGRFEVGISPQQVFFHEYAHHLKLSEATAAIPTWAVEGFAEFFASAEINKDGSVTIGKNPPYRWIQDSHSLPIEQMVGATYGDRLSGGQVEALYARGWLLTHYLAMTDGRKGQLSRYVADIQKGMTPLNSAKNAFGDLKLLDRELKAYANQDSFLGLVLSPAVIPIGPIDLRQLGAGEAAIMRIRIRSRAGVTETTAGSVASQARGIASDYPNDAAVQSVLAEAEFDAKNYAGAESAADRALAADPNDVHALIYKGRAQLELGKANPKAANWDLIRSWFLKANKLDTENAQPLALYYESFLAAAQRPTQNALDALFYAVDLAPRDGELRFTAVRALIFESRLEDAGELFAPLANNPHLDPQMRELASRIMAAIAAGDAKTALSLLSDASELAKKKEKR